MAMRAASMNSQVRGGIPGGLRRTTRWRSLGPAKASTVPFASDAAFLAAYAMELDLLS